VSSTQSTSIEERRLRELRKDQSTSPEAVGYEAIPGSKAQAWPGDEEFPFVKDPPAVTEPQLWREGVMTFVPDPP
jgi:hypothetical protein